MTNQTIKIYWYRFWPRKIMNKGKRNRNNPFNLSFLTLRRRIRVRVLLVKSCFRLLLQEKVKLNYNRLKIEFERGGGWMGGGRVSKLLFFYFYLIWKKVKLSPSKEYGV